jgi:hypothetical protein
MKSRVLMREGLAVLMAAGGVLAGGACLSAEPAGAGRAAETPPTAAPAGAPARGAAAARGEAPTALTQDRARSATHAMALAHPDPYIRESAYHDHDADWSYDIDAKTFTLVIRDPNPRTLQGRFTPGDDGRWHAEFADDEALAKPWRPDVALTQEEARKLLVSMCAALGKRDSRLKEFGDALAATPLPATQEEGELMLKCPGNVVWRINLKERRFSVSQVHIDFGWAYEGAFGWDKEKHWTAWPIRLIQISSPSASYLVIPKAPDKPTTAPGKEK